ncbi:MAG: peptidoglycan bridge formation glycyltransferase FemA/FemB family protein [Chloroflexi bacterium]|nr:MAG: peptidoglycan bridge formation glycyltransferase FemA/FemB family protein [Chloroflexota bacterium]
MMRDDAAQWDEILWDEIIQDLPGAHILQTREWGQFKAATGWQMLPQVWRDDQGTVRAAAMVLRRSVLQRVFPGGLSVLYVPRGPLVDWNDAEWSKKVISDLQSLARRQKAIFIKIDPELILGTGAPGTAEDRPNPAGERLLEDMQRTGWRFSDEQVQFRNTVWLDLQGDEADWLARMKQKARYNLRLAQRKGVQVRVGTVEDLPMLYHLYAETSVRDGFVIRGEKYYQTLWKAFMECGLAEPLIAEVEGEAVAAIFLFSFGGRAWYLYGMSSQAHRDRMPNYLLQWEAMRWAKGRGCTQYDLWGAPDIFDESDSMWGVFRFKEGLGGQVIRTAGAWDYPARPLLYYLYTRVLPRILDILRRRGRARTRQEVVL